MDQDYDKIRDRELDEYLEDKPQPNEADRADFLRDMDR